MMQTPTTRHLVMQSPVGPLVLTAEGDALTAVTFADEPVEGAASDEPPRVLVEARRQLLAYFAGELETFDLPLGGRGTPFQQRVWDELRRIPYGTTASYGEIARRLGRAPGASRAVGLANGSNPVAIVVPCHRVIGSTGRLTGYAGGLHRKRFLLGLESSGAPGSLFSPPLEERAGDGASPRTAVGGAGRT